MLFFYIKYDDSISVQACSIFSAVKYNHYYIKLMRIGDEHLKLCCKLIIAEHIKLLVYV